MNVKRVLLGLLLSSIFCTTYAQSEHFLGFRTGMNFSKFNSSSVEVNTTFKPGILLGMSYRWRFDNAWALNADILYSSRGANHDQPSSSSVGAGTNYTITTNKNSYKTRLTYIDVPIVFAYRVPIFSKGGIAPYYNTDPVASFNVYGGANVGYLYKAAQKGTINRVNDVYNSDTLVSSTSERVIIDNELDSGFSSIDINAVVGAGMLFNTGQGRRLYIDVRYNIGMASINDGLYATTTQDGKPFLYDVKTKTFQVTFGMLFSTRKKVR